MGVARSLIHELRAGLTSEEVRAAMQAVAEEHGCELPDDVIVSHGAQSAIGHDSGFGRDRRRRAGGGRHLAARQGLALLADMTRTFVAGGGEPPAELAEFWRLTRDSLDRVYADLARRASTAARCSSAPASPTSRPASRRS